MNEILNEEIDNLKEENRLLQATVLHFYTKLMDTQEPYIYTPDLIKQYKEFFNIKTSVQGKIC